MPYGVSGPLGGRAELPRFTPILWWVLGSRFVGSGVQSSTRVRFGGDAPVTPSVDACNRNVSARLRPGLWARNAHPPLGRLSPRIRAAGAGTGQSLWTVLAP